MIQASIERITVSDGHAFELIACTPTAPARAHLLWVPALGVAARNYQPLADALAAHGVAVYLHERRGKGSSTLRASRTHDWGYHALMQDLQASLAALPMDTGLPLLLGGHSLGGQLACCLAALHPRRVSQLWLVASGTPYWRHFPPPRGWLLPLAYRVMDLLSRWRGTLPGRQLGFAGTEARSVIHDWTRVGLHGRYAAPGLGVDLERALHAVTAPITGVLFTDDWYAPESSLRALLEKMPAAAHDISRIDTHALGARADHFAWMQSPAIVAERLLKSVV